MPINIHGNQYLTVAERVKMAHDSEELLEISTEVIPNIERVTVKATVKVIRTNGISIFTGMSAANPNKQIEKMSPIEVAETSAVGRALGFAGFGSAEGIATADEIIKASRTTDEPKNASPEQMAELLEALLSMDQERQNNAKTLIEGIKNGQVVTLVRYKNLMRNAKAIKYEKGEK